MKTVLFEALACVLLVASPIAFAASDTIIDPDLMNKDVWAEPVFRAPAENDREVASQVKNNVPYVKGPSQNLEVLREIPTVEPTLSRQWIEHRVLGDR